MTTKAPYHARWLQFARHLEEARAMAINLGTLPRYEDDPSIERFGGTEALDLRALLDDIYKAFNFDDDHQPGKIPFQYRTGTLTGARRHQAEARERAAIRERVLRGGGKARRDVGALATAVGKLTR